MAKKSSTLSIPLNSQTLLVVALIVVSFFTGYLFFKVKNLEKGASETSLQASAPDQQAPQVNLDAMPKITDKDHVRGNIDADLLLVEYSDFECPFCKRFHPTMKQVLQEYGNKVAWVYRHFPLSFHQNAQKEAEASECVAEQGGNDAFWKFTDAIFDRTESNGTGFALAALRPLAEELGLDAEKFQQCLDSGKYEKLVKEQMDGGTKAGISGTPGTIIVAKDRKKDLINGALPFEEVKTQIDGFLK